MVVTNVSHLHLPGSAWCDECVTPAPPCGQRARACARVRALPRVYWRSDGLGFEARVRCLGSGGEAGAFYGTGAERVRSWA
eukprot:37505-Pyramimonas_sp.AAC.3